MLHDPDSIFCIIATSIGFSGTVISEVVSKYPVVDCIKL